jgi:hypothetical protein
MFGGNKSTFGNNSGFSAFNASQPSTFNQSAFAKPATSTFGSSFGQTQNTMFGAAAPQPATGGLFGGSATTQTPGFGCNFKHHQALSHLINNSDLLF